MAKLEASGGSGSGLEIIELAPAGQYLAVCLRITDLFGVERQKFQSEEKENKDVTRFVFGLINQQGQTFLIQTYEYTISGANNSNLVKFLTQWLGRPPEMGWDYCEMQGQGAMVSVAHKQSKGTPPKTYAIITGISPVFGQLQSQLPPASHFDQLLASADAKTSEAISKRQQEKDQQGTGQQPSQGFQPQNPQNPQGGYNPTPPTQGYQQGQPSNPPAQQSHNPHGGWGQQPPAQQPPAQQPQGSWGNPQGGQPPAQQPPAQQWGGPPNQGVPSHNVQQGGPPQQQNPNPNIDDEEVPF